EPDPKVHPLLFSPKIAVYRCGDVGHQLKPARHDGTLRDVEAACNSVNLHEEAPYSLADLRAKIQADKMERHIPPKIAILDVGFTGLH
ncbi:hypothetical protein B8W95_13330, partial [Staphylococcus pasteuri]